MTRLDAAREWVAEFNAFPYGMIKKLMDNDPDEWTEVTAPSAGDRVYVYDAPEDEHCGEIHSVIPMKDCVDFVINLDDGNTVEVLEEDFEVERDGALPMWGTLWGFGDSADDYWLEEMGGIQAMSDCGFRIYSHEEFGYFLGIDGAGYDFYESHWLPLYNKRGLQWHDPATDEKEEG